MDCRGPALRLNHLESNARHVWMGATRRACMSVLPWRPKTRGPAQQLLQVAGGVPSAWDHGNIGERSPIFGRQVPVIVTESQSDQYHW